MDGVLGEAGERDGGLCLACVFGEGELLEEVGEHVGAF